MSGYFALDPRPLAPDDVQSARLLLMATLGVTPYIDRAIEVLELAERGHSGEYRASVVARDGTVAALALYGSIEGTAGGYRIHSLVLAPTVVVSDVGSRLLGAIEAIARSDRARYVLAEFPDDPAIGSVVTLLAGYGFEEQGRVPDFYREGIALTFLMLSL